MPTAVVTADSTRPEVDAIVDAAKPTLRGGGVDGAVCRDASADCSP